MYAPKIYDYDSQVVSIFYTSGVCPEDARTLRPAIPNFLQTVVNSRRAAQSKSNIRLIGRGRLEADCRLKAWPHKAGVGFYHDSWAAGPLGQPGHAIKVYWTAIAGGTIGGWMAPQPQPVQELTRLNRGSPALPVTNSIPAAHFLPAFYSLRIPVHCLALKASAGW